jgi:putative oxidoreductase
MLETVLAPYGDWGLLLLRAGLAIVFFAHGWPKLKGPAAFTGFIKQIKFPAPVIFAWIVILLETVGAILLLAGFGTRELGILLAINMLVAIRSVKIGMAKSGFTGSPGWEFEFILLVASLALTLTGAGAISLDAIF